jgi:hypothetical protein
MGRTWLEFAQQAKTAPRQQKLGLDTLASTNGVFNLLKDNLIITARGTS